MTISKLLVELENTHGDASLVSRSSSGLLNRVERLSASCEMITNNLGEENLPLKRERQDSQEVPVYVLNMRGQPLMPTTPCKARILLKEKKAQVIRRTPFTIQLNYPTEETKQPITLGIDAGYSKIGFSAITEKKELIAGEVVLRMDVSKKLDDRRMYRRNRRSRLWYRKPRHDHWKKTQPKGWLAPSIRHKLDTHIRLVEKIKQILPITQTTVEVASFDTQKMQNPNIQGVEYQQGTLFGYTVRNYLLEKWGHKCAYCGKSDIPLEIDHIIPISKISNNRIDNLTIACRKCNQKKGNKMTDECGPKLRKRMLEIQKKATESFKGATFMNIVRRKMVDLLGSDCQYTYGDRTKYQRTRLGLSKSHVNDAFVIASGTSQTFSKVYRVKQIRRNNRCLQLNRKRFKPAIRKQRYPYQRNDHVKYNNGLYRVKGTHCKGTRVMLYTPNQQKKIKSVSVKKIELITYGKGLSFQ
ncbi:MAG: RNA-guided endonuclease IscB [Candidatus Bathyarchaeia archaeon]